MTESSRPLHTLFRALTNVVSVGYLAACVLLLAWAHSVSSGDTPDASLAGVWPLFATLPVSFVLFLTPGLPGGPGGLVLAVCVGALANAIVTGATLEAFRSDRRRAGPTA
ncbi:SCO4225 family membrane protein [Streptomyces alboflavus]|uniref:SCO4225 family membrane protein n=1 Tax=Streptomyces alboflavus TaxID=67267 RepID=UPI0004BF6BF5|nr:hypothetical protein [Streptomyces alboflavus]